MKNIVLILSILLLLGCKTEEKEILELVKDKYYLNISSNKNKITTRIISNLEIDSITITPVNEDDVLEYEFSGVEYTIRPTNFIKEPRTVIYNLIIHTNKGDRAIIDSFNVFFPEFSISNLAFNFLYFNESNIVEVSILPYGLESVTIRAENAVVERVKHNLFKITPNKLGKIMLNGFLIEDGIESKIGGHEFFVINKTSEEIDDLFRNNKNLNH